MQLSSRPQLQASRLPWPCKQPCKARASTAGGSQRHQQHIQEPQHVQHPEQKVSAAWGKAALAAAVSCWLYGAPQPCYAEDLAISFPASANPEIRAAQKTLVESWAYVDSLYVDRNNHTEWANSLQDALAASFKVQSADDVTQITQDLLAKLHDPYTRLLQSDEDTALAAEEEGKIVATGLGLQQLSLTPAAAGSSNGTPEEAQEQQQLVMVSFVVDGSPAAAAGVKEGDALITVAGQPVGGKELRDIYKLLSREADLVLARQPPLPAAAVGSSGGSSSGAVEAYATTQPLSGLDRASTQEAGAATAGGVLEGVEQYSVTLKPGLLEFDPVQYGIIDLSKAPQHTSSPGNTSATPSDYAAGSSSGGSNASAGGVLTSAQGRVGYLKLLTFSATAPQAVAEALQDIQQEAATQPGGLSGLIVDLRDNPGGIVEAGVDIAQDFLRAGQVLCIAVDQSGEEEQVVLPEAHTLTQLPLAVLVNHSTASTSELLAGALHDELHAPLIGTTTYGKGRTQRVIRLSDGKSTLLVSTLKYFTPQHSTIDGVGLALDTVCSPDEVLGSQWVGGKEEDGGSLLDDPCIKLAAQRLAGVA